MATNLKSSHAAAIARLRAFKPPPTNYFSLPAARRAAVLILLYADKRGELRVVLTMRAKTLNAGQAALPGGKADSLHETAYATARREAYEEIGLPLSDSELPQSFKIHHLCQLPLNLARTNLGVRPCVAFLEADPKTIPSTSQLSNPVDSAGPESAEIPSGLRKTRSVAGTASREGSRSSADDVLIPRLDAKEVAAVFTAPFEAFLETSLESSASFSTQSASFPSSASSRSKPDTYNPDPNYEVDENAWYSGQWVSWHDTTWRMHNFYVPSNSQPVAWAEKPPTTMTMNRFRVFGMTARILVDAARVAFGREPKFEHNAHLGDEDLIGVLVRAGSLDVEDKESGGGAIGSSDGKADDEKEQHPRKQAEREQDRARGRRRRRTGSNI